MPRIIWSNGQVDTAATWDDLLDVVRADQWKPYSDDGFRQELATRAWRWSLTDVDPDLPADELFARLAAARLVLIIDDKDKDKEV